MSQDDRDGENNREQTSGSMWVVLNIGADTVELSFGNSQTDKIRRTMRFSYGMP